jgi:hypothetical protein
MLIPSNRPRHTQCLLNDMLSKSYRQKRPKNRTTMGERLAFLRSARCGQLQTDLPPPQGQGNVAKECAILLQARPGSGREADSTRARATSGEPDDDFDDSPCSPFDQKPGIVSDLSQRSPETGEPSRSSLDSDGEAAGAAEERVLFSPAIFRNPWSACSKDVRCDTAEFLRERCPSRSSSFLADVASLLGGLSIRSSLSRSSSSGPPRRSVGSVSSKVGVTDSGVQGVGRNGLLLRGCRRRRVLRGLGTWPWPGLLLLGLMK